MPQQYSATLLIFSKLPLCTEAKSRLRRSKILPEEFVQRLHSAFVHDTFTLAINTPLHTRIAAWYPHYKEEELQRLSGTSEQILHISQHGATFEERFIQGIQAAFAHTPQDLIIIGTDCPMLTPTILTQACAEVTKGKVVIGPAQAGGFYLLGIPYTAYRVNLKGCFTNGAESVQVAQLLHGHPLTLLPLLNDIDTEDDLFSFCHWLTLARTQATTQPRDLIYIPSKTAQLLEEVCAPS